MTEERRRVPVPDFTKGSPPAPKGEKTKRPKGEPAEPAPCDCPRLDAADWDGVESDWSDITFLKTTVSALLGVPIGYGTSRHGLEEKAKRAGATIPQDAMVLLGGGRLSRRLLLEVEDLPANTRGVVRPGGVAYTKLLDVPWGQMRKAVEDTKKEAVEKYKRKPDAIWVWYLTCRECSAVRNFETLIVAHYKARR